MSLSGRFWITYCVLWAGVAFSYAQPTLSGDFSNRPLTELIQTYQRELGLQFAFDTELVGARRSLDLVFEQASIEDVLEASFPPLGIAYTRYQERSVILRAADRIYTVHGTVRDGESGSPLAYARVALPGLGMGATTDEHGTFVFEALPAGPLACEVRYFGYAPTSVALSPGQQTHLDFFLVAHDHALPEIVIAQEQGDGSLKIEGKTGHASLSTQQILPRQMLGGPDVLGTVQLLPGVTGSWPNGGRLNIRGGTDDQNLVLFDGITVYRVDHFFGMFSAFNPDVVHRMDIFRGNFGPEYGGRVSAVLDIQGQNVGPEGFSARGEIDLLNARMRLSVPLPDRQGGFLVAARRSYSEMVESPIYKDLFEFTTQRPDRTPTDPNEPIHQSTEPADFYDENAKIDIERLEDIVMGEQPLEENALAVYDLNTQLRYQPPSENRLQSTSRPDFQFFDWNGRFNRYIGKRDHLVISVYRSGDQLAYHYDDHPLRKLRVRTRDEISLENTGTSLSWSRQWNPRLFSRTRFAFSQHDNNYRYNFIAENDSLAFRTFIIQESRIRDLNARTDWQYHTRNGHKFSGGFEAVRQQTYFRFLQDSLGITDKRAAHTASVYGEHAFRLGNRLDIQYGGRISYFEPLRRVYAEPRLALGYDVAENFRLKAGAGRYNQFVNRVRMNNGLGLGESFWVNADGAGIPVLRSNQYSLGFSFQKNDFLLDVETYFKHLNGLISYTYGPAPTELREGGDFHLITGGRQEMAGLEIMVQKKIGVYTAWLSYTLGSVRERFENINQGNYYPSLQDQRHELKTSHQLQLGRWEISSTWTFGTGRPYTSAVLRYASVDGENGQYSLLPDIQNANRLPLYHRLDFSATYHFGWGRIGLSVYNAYNRRNVLSRRYYLAVPLTQYHEYEASPNDVQDLGFTPNVFFGIKF